MRSLEDGRQYPIGVERMTTQSEIQATMDELAAGARTEVISVLAGPAPSAEILAASRQRDLTFAQRLVTTRILYPLDYAGLPHVASYARALAVAGAEVRFADRLPHRLLVFDRRVAVVPGPRTATGTGAVVVRQRVLARSLAHMAVAMFRTGRPLHEEHAGISEPLGPTAMDRRMLELMGSGLADGAIARRLGVTDRTFRRYVGSLLARLGASSRFDAGVKAVERGWV